MPEPTTLTLEIVRDDDMPAFGAFLRPMADGETEQLHMRLNVLGLFVSVGEDGKEIRFAPEEVRRNLVGTLMHEFGHALEYLMALPTAEAEIEAACEAWAGVEVEIDGAPDLMGLVAQENGALADRVAALTVANKTLRTLAAEWWAADKAFEDAQMDRDAHSAQTRMAQAVRAILDTIDEIDVTVGGEAQHGS